MTTIGRDEVVEVDIRTRIVSPSDQVYILFPGEAHRLFQDMRRREVAFLDFPGLDLGRSRIFAELPQA